MIAAEALRLGVGQPGKAVEERELYGTSRYYGPMGSGPGASPGCLTSFFIFVNINLSSFSYFFVYAWVL